MYKQTFVILNERFNLLEYKQAPYVLQFNKRGTLIFPQRKITNCILHCKNIQKQQQCLKTRH